MIDKTAIVSAKAKIGRNVRIWAFSHVREGALIGDNTIVGEHVYIDCDVVVGDSVKIQNNAQIYSRTILEAGVFIGPGVVITNDKYPRSIDSKGRLLKAGKWQQGRVQIGYGASIGAGSILVTGIKVGKYAMVGAGSVVVRDVKDHELVLGNPAKKVGMVCSRGHTVKLKNKCSICGEVSSNG